MIYYQAVCSAHNFASNLFISRHRAVLSARAHMRRVQGPHQMKILKVFIPRNAVRIDASDDFD